MPEGTILVAEEAREGKKSLALVSLRKVPGAKNAKELLPSVLLNARNDAGVNSIIVDAPNGAQLDHNAVPDLLYQSAEAKRGYIA